MWQEGDRHVRACVDTHTHTPFRVKLLRLRPPLRVVVKVVDWYVDEDTGGDSVASNLTLMLTHTRHPNA